MPITIGDQTACAHGRWDPTVPTWRDDLRNWVVKMHDIHGWGWMPIAGMLNDARVPTLSGGSEWRASSVKSLYDHTTRSQGGARTW